MNWFWIISGVLAALTTAGHLFSGYKQEVRPMLEAEFDSLPKQTMHAIFHFGTVALMLSTIFLLLAGFGFTFNKDPLLVVLFVASYFLFCDVVLFLTAFTTGIPKKPLVPVWVLFTLVGVTAVLGAV